MNEIQDNTGSGGAATEKTRTGFDVAYAECLDDTGAITRLEPLYNFAKQQETQCADLRKQLYDLSRKFVQLVKSRDDYARIADREIKLRAEAYQSKASTKQLECVSEMGKNGILWTVFEGAPFVSRRIASFCSEEDARYWLGAVEVFSTLREIKLREALQVAINTVECASINPATGEELPWYKLAKAALAI